MCNRLIPKIVTRKFQSRLDLRGDLRVAWLEIVVEIAEMVTEEGGRIAADAIFFEMVTGKVGHRSSEKQAVSSALFAIRFSLFAKPRVS